MNKASLSKEIRKVNYTISKHSPAILTIIGVAGMVTTVVMACNAAPKAKELLEERRQQIAEYEEEETRVEQISNDVRTVAPVYFPVFVMGTLTLACFISSYKITAKRAAALATAYHISERTLREYQDKVIETIGEKKEEKIRDEIAKDRIAKNPPSNNPIILTNKGDTLCYDSLSGRYFRMNIDKIRKAETILNRRLLNEMFVSLNDFYYEIDIPAIELGDDIGWNVDNEIAFRFSSQLTEDDEPCLVIEYHTAPRYDYRKLL